MKDAITGSAVPVRVERNFATKKNLCNISRPNTRLLLIPIALLYESIFARDKESLDISTCPLCDWPENDERAGEVDEDELLNHIAEKPFTRYPEATTLT